MTILYWEHSHNSYWKLCKLSGDLIIADIVLIKEIDGRSIFDAMFYNISCRFRENFYTISDAKERIEAAAKKIDNNTKILTQEETNKLMLLK